MNKLISIIIPVCNEEENIPLIYGEIKKIWNGLKDRYNCEIVFIDDGSQDKSFDIIKELSVKDQQVRYLRFSRHFGKEAATSAGICYAAGDAAIIIDADLQHPPELIPEFIKKWEAGAETVIGVRKANFDKGIIKKIGSNLFYRIMNRIGETKFTPRATDFRLIDRKMINEFKKFTERNRITRGILSWMGFKKDFIYFTAPARKFGRARYGFCKLFRLACHSFVSHSLLPLKIAGYLGVLIILTSSLLGIYVFITQYIIHRWAIGFSHLAELAILNIFLIGIVLSCLGLIALYIGSIHQEVSNRPMYIIKKDNIINNL